MPEFTHVDFPNSEKLQKLTSKENKFGRFYKTPKGEYVPSVTTVIGWAERNKFKEWRERSPENAQKASEASVRGETVHSMVEAYLSNTNFDPFDFSPKYHKLFEAMRPALDRIQNIRCLEGQLWSHEILMAGRCDCIAEFDGKLAVIDFKVFGKSKPEEWMQSYYKQAAAYALMFEEMTGVPITRFVIIESTEENTVKVTKGNALNYVKPLMNTIENFWLEIGDNIQKLAEIE